MLLTNENGNQSSNMDSSNEITKEQVDENEQINENSDDTAEFNRFRRLLTETVHGIYVMQELNLLRFSQTKFSFELVDCLEKLSSITDECTLECPVKEIAQRF